MRHWKKCNCSKELLIGDDVYIEENANIKNSLIYNEAYISKNTMINNSIISDNCLIEKNVQLEGEKENLVILGSFVKVNKDIKLISKNNRSISYCHHENVTENII